MYVYDSKETVIEVPRNNVAKDLDPKSLADLWQFDLFKRLRDTQQAMERAALGVAFEYWKSEYGNLLKNYKIITQRELYVS